MTRQVKRVGTTADGGTILEIVHARDLELDSEDARTTRVAVELISTTLEELRALATGVSDVARVSAVLMERLTDTTHLTVAEAARFAGLSTKSIRNRVSKGILTLETIPGRRRWGIPVEQLASGWVSAAQAGRLRGRKGR